MKIKVVYAALISLFAGAAMAQDCTFFFPQTEGTQLVRKGYDGQGNLKNIMTYKIDEVKNIPSGTEVEADYVYTDAQGRQITRGELECTCQNGEFFMDMSDLVSYPTAVSMIDDDIVITSDFMNYPNAFPSDLMGSGDDYYFDDATIKIYSKKNKKNRANISIYDREYVTTEDMTTPAGTFNCAKVRYNVDINSPKGKMSGYGYEWYAPNVGIVRSEQYDNGNTLQSYTVLEEIK